MQDTNLDTEWNDVLRKHGIIPKKEKEITEDQLISLMTDTIEKYEEKQKNMQNVESYTMEQLNEVEDDIDEDIIEKIRIEEMKNLQKLKKFGSVIEITASTYVEEINKAGKDIWVVLHLYQSFLPICKIINEGINNLAKKFVYVKFVKGIASECIKDYPDKNVPTIFIFKNANLIHSIIGPINFGAYNYKNCENLLEWTLSTIGVLKTDQTIDPYLNIKNNKTQISSSIFGRGYRNINEDY